MLTKKMVKVPASRIPDGMLYGLASYTGNRPYALNRAEVRRGAVKILQAEGDTAFLTFVALVDSSGRKIVVFPTVSDPVTHLLTVATGNKVSLGRELTKGLYSYACHSLSPDGRYLAYAWTRDNSTAKERKRTYGYGVYDTVSQQRWEQVGAFFPAWSASGQHFVFARFFLTDGPLPEQSKTPEPPASDNRKGSRRTDASIVDELYYFAKDVRGLGDGKAERISQKQAAQLVGKWYRTALIYALSDGVQSFDSLTSGAAVAPGGRGAVLIDSFNRKTNSLPDQPPMPPNAIDFEWRTQIIDATGQPIVYDPSPVLSLLFWSGDGERVYAMTGQSANYSPEGKSLICLWVRSGSYAVVKVPEKLRTIISYIEK